MGDWQEPGVKAAFILSWTAPLDIGTAGWFGYGITGLLIFWWIMSIVTRSMIA